MREVMALVLSGGGGERLSVLSSERAVSAIPFGGKYRIIDFALSNCCHSEIERIGVITQYAPTSLHDHIGSGRAWDLDRRGGGIVILQPYQTRTSAGWYRGTADAIAQNWDVIEERGCSRVLILSGDHVYLMDYRALIDAHLAQGAEATLAVAPVAADQTHRFGIVTLDAAGDVERLVEKPRERIGSLASMGVYVFECRALRDRLQDSSVDLVVDVVTPMLASGTRVAAHRFESYWEDVGTIASYYRANLELLEDEPKLVLDDRRWPILTRDEERPPVRIGDQARIERSLISNGCRIEGTVRRSVLSPGVVVEPGAVIEDSVVLQDVVVGREARVRRSILDKYARIGERARIGAWAAPADARAIPGPAWLEGLVLIGKDSRLPAGLCVEPGVVVGVAALPTDFAQAVVPAGTEIANRTWYGADA
ncbi:MAG: glucose-1-phosphate adenylyltransferase [Candidatus Eisenbacteria bacterium]|nr:glucose-1-phosphate adenylyltransferase [Candidatus Eisenbacteria bacterium]